MVKVSKSNTDFAKHRLNDIEGIQICVKKHLFVIIKIFIDFGYRKFQHTKNGMIELSIFVSKADL